MNVKGLQRIYDDRKEIDNKDCMFRASEIRGAGIKKGYMVLRSSQF